MRAASALALHQSLIIQVGVKSERKGYSFQPALLSPPQRASQSAFLLTSPHRDLASQSPPHRHHPPPPADATPLSTIPLSSLPAPVMSHAIWFSAASSRKSDLVSGERKGEGERRSGGGGKQERSSSSCDWKVERNAGGGGGAELCEANEERVRSGERHVQHRRRSALALAQTHVCTHS